MTARPGRISAFNLPPRDTYAPHKPGFLQGQPMWINAIHYSLHDPDVIAGYMTALQTALGHLNRARQEKARNPDTWMDPRPEIDAFGALICPLLRARRVLDLTNDELHRDPDYPLDLQQIRDIDALQADAEEPGRCVHERTAGAERLFFEAVGIRLAFKDY